jgi:hypothetical protein
MGLEAGQIIEGKYRIVRLLGEGGMGAVYEGENVRIHRKVAIKVLHAGVANNPDVVQRFEREAQAAGRIGSEHIVEVLDLGSLTDGDRFMVMEYLDGVSLGQRIEGRGKLTPVELAPIALQLLEGLGAAHGAGIIHRDLKPDNVFLVPSKKGQTDYVKILDFGISKFSPLASDSGMSMTRTGAVMGTPFYMSPEQAKGAKDMDHRSDLYSAGVILYQAVTGQLPFNAETFNELIFKIVLDVVPPPEQLVPDLDPNFASIIRKAMAREPAQRFQTAQEFMQAVSTWVSSGSGVTFPRDALPSQTSEAAAVPARPGGPPLAHNGTAASWAQTGPGGADAEPPVVPVKGRGGLFAGLAVAAIAVLGGGAWFATRGGSGKPAPNAGASMGVATTSEAVPLPPVATAAAPAAPLAAAAAAPVIALAPADPAPPPVPVAAEPAGAKKVPLNVAPTKHAAAALAAKPAAPPAPAPAAAGGRKFRTEL